MKRWLQNLAHYSNHCGHIGRLSCLAVIPVVGGDSIDINLDGVMRLSPLRRNLTVDCKIDLFGFFVPHRHVYGSDWTDMVKQGVDTAITLDAGPTPAVTNTQYYLAQPNTWAGNPGTAYPKWLMTGYNRIWNRYFRHPSDTAGILADAAVITGSAEGENFGRLCCHLKTIWTTPLWAGSIPASADREVPAVTVLDLVALAQIKARYRTEVELSWFATRYNDIMQRKYGGGVNTDADERPTLLKRQSSFMSGYDVDGTDDASLGSYSGKAASIVNFNLPRRYYPEHGTIFIMGLLRFPVIHENETHYLIQQAQPTYKQIMGDPDITAEEEPFLLKQQDIFADGDTSNLGYIPFGQWWRTHPSYVHKNYDELNGFPFINTSPGTESEATYIQNNDYDNMFQTTQLGQWQCQSRISVDAMRVVPPAKSSIFAGA